MTYFKINPVKGWFHKSENLDLKENSEISKKGRLRYIKIE
jgi:hypothetical protein